MTTTDKQSLNVAIAEAMGWSRWKTPDLKVFLVREFYPGYLGYIQSCGAVPTDETITESLNHKLGSVPNFTGSLDACAEFEKALDRKPDDDGSAPEYNRYCRWLDVITEGDAPTATPTQRCEAFCRVRKIGPFAEGKG